MIVALAAVVWFAGSRGWDGLNDDQKAEATARYSAEASRIVGRSVEIRCDESGRIVGAVQHSDGVAEVGGDVAYLTPARCYDLYRQAFEGGGPFSQTARAVAVLAHESWHLRGERDEGRTECFALQSGVDLARRLGATRRHGAAHDAPAARRERAPRARRPRSTSSRPSAVTAASST